MEKKYEEITIRFNPTGDKIDKPTILQLLIKKGVDIEYNCLDGHCAMCKCDKPTQGEIKIKEGKKALAYIKKDSEGNEEEILPCISILDTSKIKLDQEGKGVLSFKFPKEKIKNTKEYNEKEEKSNKRKVKF